MTTVTLNVSETLAKRLEPIGPWLPYILEVSLLKIKTPTAEMASEIVEFLSSNPTIEAVRNFHASQKDSQRIAALLESNQTGILSEAEVKELDEMMKLEHFIRNLKARLPESALTE